MRWGILVNLAIILFVSGVLLFIAFCASLERAAVDSRVYQAAVLFEALQKQILSDRGKDRMWERVRDLCREQMGFGLLLYDAHGTLIGGCGLDTNTDKPDQTKTGKTVRAEKWPTGLFHGMVVTVDSTGDFPEGIRTARGIMHIPASVFAPAWKFFGAYLVLTQGALFFLGYLLFHRTVIGPLADAADLARKAAGFIDLPSDSYPAGRGDDIQKIASRLRVIIAKILDDRQKMEALIVQLSTANKDLEKAQQGLVRSEKLAGVGRLAAGLAHEIGNPLQILMGYTELLERNAHVESRAEILTRMSAELKRINEILRHLLEFARPIRKQIEICNINELVKSCSALILGRKGFRNITFQIDLAEELPLLETEPEKLRQTLVNLLFNAADAIGDSGGTISLRTSATPDRVLIEVEDSGCGIPESDLSKIFDPFFTTKEPGKGTGLGLAVCLALVESLDGSIQISSVVGTGTTVLVSLPIREPSVI
ncbi:sensor histidine kinase [Desulfomonile tiedjei]|uniref:histidine kinase n=1 Tax=Desulfomonile tiedjei (strain ATCC 49306 / DSM 6799 / DCB-1) TaxID=706587 RepID=I4BZQ7_DESTA|nr:ATP-binding protein [Desulfomonile tiedjei]AFM22798.1 histidine kinase [Desulfomonile tiedjei DSM 6799]